MSSLAKYVAVASPSRLGFVARMTSTIWLSASLNKSWRMFRCSGPMPSIGFNAPPKMWYLPLNSWVRSIATISLGSSTTQIVFSCLLGLRQMLHSSSWDMLLQILQNFALSLTSSKIFAKFWVSVLSVRSKWNAILCADFGPIPGSFASWLISSCTIPSYIKFLFF